MKTIGVIPDTYLSVDRHADGTVFINGAIGEGIEVPADAVAPLIGLLSTALQLGDPPITVCPPTSRDDGGKIRAWHVIGLVVLIAVVVALNVAYVRWLRS